MADRGILLLVAMGHELLGEVMAVGPDADPQEAPVGKTMLVFPWIGCGTCAACDELRENDGLDPRFMGLVRDGGYAHYALVEHPKCLVNVDGLDLDTVTPYACSGLTVLNALKRAGSLRKGQWLSVLGTGGLGLNAIAIARALGYESIVGVDNSNAKLKVTTTIGADAVLDSSQDNASVALRELTGNRRLAVIDTVGVPGTARRAIDTLSKTGRFVCVGLHGGTLKMPLPWLPQKALSVCGVHVGSSLMLRELIELVKTGKIREMPVESRPLSSVNQTPDDLEHGRITGRVVSNAD